MCVYVHAILYVCMCASASPLTGPSVTGDDRAPRGVSRSSQGTHRSHKGTHFLSNLLSLCACVSLCASRLPRVTVCLCWHLIFVRRVQRSQKCVFVAFVCVCVCVGAGQIKRSFGLLA